METAERTRKHCMMMENYSYMPFHLLMLNMAKQGFFGDIVHGDCAYNTSKMGNNFNKNLYWNMWWLRQYGSRKGNIYPTHGLGPVVQMMDINRGDKFEFLVSVESKDFMMAANLPPGVIIFGLPFLVSFLIGVTMPTVAITFPFLTAFIGTGDQAQMGLQTLAFSGLLCGLYLTPVHICLSLSASYFRVPLPIITARLLLPTAFIAAAGVTAALFF